MDDIKLCNSMEDADQVIDESERTTLSEGDTRKILDLLDQPRDPNPNMVAILRSRATD